MPSYQGKEYLVIAREDLSSQAKARLLAKATLKVVAKFLQENIVYHYRYFRKLVIDREPKNKAYITKFVKKYRVYYIQVSIYYLQANKIVERGHQLIIEALA